MNAELLKSGKLLKLAMLVDIVKQVISVTPVRRVNSANVVKPVDTRDPRVGATSAGLRAPALLWDGGRLLMGVHQPDRLGHQRKQP